MTTKDNTADVRRIPIIVKIFFAIDVFLCAIFVLYHISGVEIDIINQLVDLNGETSIAAWFSSIQFFCIFLFTVAYTLHQLSQNKKSIALLAFPALFLMLSMDESIMIHEWIGYRASLVIPNGTISEQFFNNGYIWVLIVGIPFVVAFSFWAYAIKPFFKDQPAQFKKLILGMTILLLGALVFEALIPVIPFFNVEVALEEGCEMLGATIMLWAVHDLTLHTLPTQHPLQQIMTLSPTHSDGPA